MGEAMGRPVRLSNVGDLEDYPISANDRLDSHYFFQWNLKRWRGSGFRKVAYTCPDVGFYAFELFCAAHDETPVGTLPCDDSQLAFMLHMPLEKWQDLLGRKVTPLHGWFKVRCDNGEIRLAHRVVTEVVAEALKSKIKNENDRIERARAKRLQDLRAMVERIGAKQLLSSPQFIERFDDFLEAHFAGRQRREGVIRQALDQFSMGLG